MRPSVGGMVLPGSTARSDRVLRRSFLRLTQSSGVRGLMTHSPFTGAIRRRFVAGDNLEDFLRVAGEVRNEGFGVTGNLLGEAVKDSRQAEGAAAAYLELLDRLGSGSLDVNVSLKLTQLGFDLDPAEFRKNLGSILTRAEEVGAFLRFDMESSAYTARTLAAFEELWAAGARQVGIVLQACLRRTAGDVGRMIELGAPVRLCKGAYAEPDDVAYRNPAKVRENFQELAWWLLSEGRTPAIATHDEGLIRGVIDHASRMGIDERSFEFQFLFGVRRDLQRELMQRGYRVRVYIPYGDNWYPYLMRRLAERPENVLFMVGSMVKESPFGSLLPGRRGIGDTSP